MRPPPLSAKEKERKLPFACDVRALLRENKNVLEIHLPEIYFFKYISLKYMIVFLKKNLFNVLLNKILVNYQRKKN